MPPEGGARSSRATPGRIRLRGCVPVVALVRRFTTEEVAEVLVVAGAFWASRLISLIPPGWKQNFLGKRMIW